jgi:hypothetical protein
MKASKEERKKWRNGEAKEENQHENESNINISKRKYQAMKAKISKIISNENGNGENNQWRRNGEKSSWQIKAKKGNNNGEINQWRKK